MCYTNIRMYIAIGMIATFLKWSSDTFGYASLEQFAIIVTRDSDASYWAKTLLKTVEVQDIGLKGNRQIRRWVAGVSLFLFTAEVGC